MFRILIFIFISFPLFATNLKEIIVSSKSSDISLIRDKEALKSQLKVDTIKSEYMPSISIAGGYKQLFKDRFIIEPRQSVSAFAKLDFVIYDGGRREAILSALSNLAQNSSIKSDEFKNELAFSLTKLYFSAVFTQSIIDAQSSQKEYLLNEVKRLQSLKSAGLATDDELSSILAKYHLSSSEELGLKQELAKTLSSIELLSGVQPNELDFVYFLDPDFNQKSENLELKALEFELLATKYEIDKERASYLPTIFLQNKFSIHNSKFKNNLGGFEVYADRFLDRGLKKSNEFMLGFNWSIFNFGATSKNEQMAYITHSQVALNLNHKRRQNDIDIKNLKSEIAILKDKIRANELFLKSAKDALISTYKKYKAGLLKHTDFLFALSNEFNAKSLLSGSRAELEIKKAEYYLKSGIEIETRIGN